MRQVLERSGATRASFEDRWPAWVDPKTRAEIEKTGYW